MKCDNCNKPATVHLTEIKNGKKIEKHLCEQCAAQNEGLAVKSHTPINELLTNFVLAHSGLTKETDRRSVLQGTDRLFECLEGVVRTCPECSKKKLPLGALIVHLNDAHHWTRERIAAWVADPDVPQDESHAHH